jgi:hypothetical protein
MLLLPIKDLIFFRGGMNDDFIDHIRLTKPPPACMCNCSGGDPRVYSLVACEPKAMLVLSVNQTKTINQFAKIVTVLGEQKKKKRGYFRQYLFPFLSP